ncbi:MAG: helix-turn-helix domain-containing protein [Oscillospiraceae bacterium]|nr:helix-turn-helix domain-containing protein [Oscillospiraceae bacterium]
MGSDFPRILTLLRKEKGISQKSAAADLGISQALLSHYEKGIRECGLNFLVRSADYYGVSCDYLLGRSPDRQGATLTVEDIPESDQAGRENRGSILPTLSKKLLANSQNLLFDLLSKTGSKSMISEASAYMMLSLYKMLRLTYASNPKNQEAMFSLPLSVALDYTDAAMHICEANAVSITKGNPLPGLEPAKNADDLALSTEIISQAYPMWASSLFNLVQTCEKRIDFRNKSKP